MKFTANTLALQKALIPFIDLNPLREKIMVGLNLKSGMLTVSFCDEGEVFKMKSELGSPAGKFKKLLSEGDKLYLINLFF